MNRLLICIILLSISSVASAETLYRWIEPDGSITFSPTKPAASVKYTTVTAPDASQGLKMPDEPAMLATSEQTSDPALPRVNDTKILTRPVPAVSARQGLNYAPETASSTGAMNELQDNSVEPTIAAPQRNTVVSANKRRQCQDLSKRVMSLERRLRSTLGPDDMDNTVIAMARYQRSYDQHCIE